MISKARRFRELFERPGLIIRSCAYDALSAILIERAGFECVGTTGYGISASTIGQPDIGLLSFGGMFDQVRHIINAVNIPVDVDADTGYGNAQNVYWTVLSYARIGAASVRIEDQQWPKRCGHMAGKHIIPADEMVEKIRAARKAADEYNPDLMIGARTDARSIEGFDGTIARCEAYADAGADYVYVECPADYAEVERLVKGLKVPLAFNIIPGGRTPIFDIKTLSDMGVKFLSIPMVCLYPATLAMMKSLEALRAGDLKKVGEMGVSWATFNEIVGIGKWNKLESDFIGKDAPK
ncbi:MAG: oxaloacetate decarboxylase [Phycisphaerae bacterium]